MPPERRQIGMVFQDYAIFPHLSVADNVAYGLNGWKPSQARANPHMLRKLVGMARWESAIRTSSPGGSSSAWRWPAPWRRAPAWCCWTSRLEPGRGPARACVTRCAPSSRRAATAIFVTHDQEEALYMGDRLAVFRKGHVEQIGLPEEIFHTPATRFVAEFMGSTDFLAGEVTPDGILTELGLLVQKVELPVGAMVEIAMRPDDVSFEPQAQGRSMVLERMFRGAYNVYRLHLPSGHLLHTYQPHTRLVKPGTRARVYINAGHDLAIFHEGRAVNGEQK